MAIGLKQYFAKRGASNLAQVLLLYLFFFQFYDLGFKRIVPLGAVAVANAINIPLMRQKLVFFLSF